MKYLVIYKSDFRDGVAGVGVRYLSIATELIAGGNQVVIAGSQIPDSDRDGIEFIDVRRTGQLVRAIRQADRIILQGGGPVILLLLAFLSNASRRVLLDAFAPHWLELYSAARGRHRQGISGLKLWTKVYFNYFRLLWARLFFHVISVGTARQLDLIRGIVSQVGDLRLDQGLVIITGGCEPCRPQASGAKKSTPLAIGWIGGLWDWFNERPIVDSILQLAKSGYAAEMNFYGVSEEKKQRIRDHAERSGVATLPIKFHPWIPYAQRLDAWSTLDVGIVWSDPSLENDYASRTRNFDCITLGIPVIQNQDFFWADIIKEVQCGTVVERSDDIHDAILGYLTDTEKLAAQSDAIRRLETRFCWAKIARDYEAAFASNMGRARRGLSAVLCCLIVLPASLLVFALNLRFKEPLVVTTPPYE